MAEWIPSDAWLAGWVRQLRGLPCDADVSSWVPVLRRELAAELAAIRERKRRADEEAAEEEAAVSAAVRRRRKVDEVDAAIPAPRRRRGGGGSASEVVRDLLMSPEGATLILVAGLLTEMVPHLSVRFAAQAGVLFRQSAWREALPVHRYLAQKLGQPTPWAACGPVPRPSPIECAAVNAVTPRQAREWLERLETRSEPEVRATLGEIREVGRRAEVAVAPLRLRDPESGPPRGLWPDPPPPDPSPGVSADVAAGAKPAFVVGRGA